MVLHQLDHAQFQYPKFIKELRINVGPLGTVSNNTHQPTLMVEIKEKKNQHHHFQQYDFEYVGPGLFKNPLGFTLCLVIDGILHIDGDIRHGGTQ